MDNIRLLGISGSLREHSTNTIILKTIGTLLSPHITFDLYNELHLIPPFSPGEADAEVVTRFKEKVANASGVIICTPEYAFGVPGVLKNTLDWTVASGEFNEKPVAAISASPLYSGGEKALESLLLTLTALGTTRNENSALSIPNVKSKISVEGSITHIETLQQLQAQVNNLIKIIVG